MKYEKLSDLAFELYIESGKIGNERKVILGLIKKINEEAKKISL